MFGEDPNFIGYRLVFATITIISFITNPRIVKKPRLFSGLPAIAVDAFDHGQNRFKRGYFVPFPSDCHFDYHYKVQDLI